MLNNFPWNRDKHAWPYVGKTRHPNYKNRAMTLRVGDRLRWTISRQAWAVEQGFFVQRCNDFIPREHQSAMERVVIHSIAEVKGTGEQPLTRAQKKLGWHHISHANPVGTIQTIKNYCKLDEPRYLYLYEFIKQQDQYGWVGAWDRRAEYCSVTLSWYRHYREAMKDASRAAYMTFNNKGEADFRGDLEIDEARHDKHIMEHRWSLPVPEIQRQMREGTLMLTTYERRRKALLGSAWAKPSDALDPPKDDGDLR
jgi:hypothetical protein